MLSRTSASATSIFDFPVARRVDMFDHLALASESLAAAYQAFEDTTGISLPPLEIVLTHRFPVHDLPMEHEWL